MSTPRAEPSDPDEPLEQERNRLFLRGLRAFAALSAALALYALWSVERVQLDCDLQLAAPREARPGESIPLRALVFCDLEAPAGPRLVTPPVEVILRDRGGRELTRRALSASALDTLDGTLRLPRGPASEWTLEARAHQDGAFLSTRRSLRVRPDAAGERVGGRAAGPLQQYALGRVRAVAEAPVPDRMWPRVVGGACSPEVPCTVLVWVGAPAAAITVRTGPSVTVRRLDPPRETDGLVQIELEVHGPEAELTLEARRGGSLAAERPWRIPVALGEAALLGGASLLAPDGSAGDRGAATGAAEVGYRVVFPPGRTSVTVDAFVEERWVGIAAASRPEGGAEAPAIAPSRLFGGELPPGLVRVQARADRFGSEGAATRVAYVRQRGRSDREALRELVGALEQPPWRDWLAALDERERAPRPSQPWSPALPAFALEDVQRSAAFLLAPLEQRVVPVPAASSGRPAQLERLARTRVRMRYGVAAALALSAWLIASSIARRGLRAVDEAQAILRAAREQGALEGERAEAPTDDAAWDARSVARERIGARAKVLSLVLAVALAFLAGALLIAAKSLWF